MPIVTNGLIAYYNSKQGVSGSVWSNIAPATAGTRNASITGATVQPNGVYLDGVDDSVNYDPGETIIKDFTINFILKSAPSNFESAIDSSLYVEGYGSGAGYTLGQIGEVGGKTYHRNGSDYLLGTGNVGFTIRYTASAGKLEYIYPNGTIINGLTGTQLRIESINYKSKSFLNVIRYYNRALTIQEINDNYAVGAEIGLVATPPPLPIVTTLTANKSKISDEVGKNQSIITVRFDTPVTQYVARLNGVDYTTGTLVHTGGAAAANTDATIIVDWNELTTEGSNRINVYGQNANGWTIQT